MALPSDVSTKVSFETMGPGAEPPLRATGWQNSSFGSSSSSTGGRCQPTKGTKGGCQITLEPRSWKSLAAGIFFIAIGCALMAYLIWEALWHVPDSDPNTVPDSEPQEEAQAGPKPVVVLPRTAELRKGDCGEDGPIPYTLFTVVEDCHQNKQDVLRVNVKNADLKCFEFLCYDDSIREAYVEKNFKEWKELLPKLDSKMKRDIFRFMLMYEEGGFFIEEDIDLYPSFPAHFEDWREQGLILGWGRRAPEKPFNEWCQDYGEGFCSSAAIWSFGAKPGHEVVKNVLDATKEYLKNPPANAAKADMEDAGTTSLTKALWNRDGIDLNWLDPEDSSSTPDEHEDANKQNDPDEENTGASNNEQNDPDEETAGTAGTSENQKSDNEQPKEEGDTATETGEKVVNGQAESRQLGKNSGHGGRRKGSKDKVKLLGISAFGCGQVHVGSPECTPTNKREWLMHRYEKVR
mmetsp:Transcript_52982/g.113139  ORF Transcript_52982/g.113139 Transcript_52982/m.113139 type:complete len:463 (-) Transcript_52982:86-1474(-)|eukprot:CAMPEP_0206481030 /NCGR_PEP_ID=MMETSP0324_2-20121206/37842_1 /ASSEMBLY_ACC=CAM_ASM_000836 /TAXON_ID=2866 /ORGANISM="Crypthecodinium cohnii, Strain Seligo" /LENGTH=462 /DNA_ID=CAMNT_0053958321 /DNA_START=37 /DNA_END=1425 /DNA_ORIENTATION=-